MDSAMLAHSSLSPADLAMGPDDKKPSAAAQNAKAVKALNRVPRACNACRKQKMRCINAEDPPCKRCRTAGIECLFEKPSREAGLTGEAGLERIRSLESQVADIRQGQHAIQSTLVDLVSQLRQPGGLQLGPAAFYGQSSQSPPGPGMRQGPMNIDPAGIALNGQHAAHIDPALAGVGGPGVLPPPPLMRGAGQPVPQRPGQFTPGGPRDDGAYVSPGGPPGNGNGVIAPAFANGQAVASHTQLPPISTIHDGMPPPPPRTAGPGLTAGSLHQQQQQQQQLANRRAKKARSSTLTSNEDSEEEGEGKSGIPASGLVAPWEVLRGLAEAAAERAAKENGGPEINSTEPPSRHSRSPGPISPDKGERPAKRRKVAHGPPSRPQNWPDIVTKRIISEQEARELFKIFYEGCSTFLPVFDARVDTYDALRERSPFAVDCICMVAAKVRDGGGPPSDMYTKILEEVHSMCSKTLFAPVARKEAVQAMILVSGWSDNGWLSGGHAVRMALELGMHKAWPKLLKRMKAGKSAPSNEERELVISTRTWFCLYLFEHQMSFGTGRPAILREDDGIIDCRYLLQHPLSIEDDTRLVSTVELMIYRERVHNDLNRSDPQSDHTFDVLRAAEATFRAWFDTWDSRLAKHYGDSNFYRQSLQIQQYYAMLFHNATVLRGIRGPEDVARLTTVQRDLALHSMDLARKGLNICLRYPSYREGLKYAVHYTHMSATFAASFLLRLARLFPESCDLPSIMDDVEELSSVLSKIPAGRYARTLRIMLHAHKKRRNASQSPELTMDRNRPAITVRPPSTESSMAGIVPESAVQAMQAPDGSYMAHPMSAGGIPSAGAGGFPIHEAGNFDYYMRNYDVQGSEVPLWMSEHNLGDSALSSHGLEAFILPLEFDQRAPVTQIW